MDQLNSIHHGSVSHFIDGSWKPIEGQNGEPVINPTTGDEMAFLPFATTSIVDRSVEAALDAFESWGQTPVETRIQPMFRLKHLLEAHQEELAELLVQDHGKTFSEAEGEIRRGIENVEVACGIPTMMKGGVVEHAAPDIDEMAIKQPIGVFVGVTPFNFPAMIPLWFLPYAVATGNSFILKPSEKVPLVANMLFELIEQAGFPSGVLQLVHGGPDAVNAFIDHPDVAGISFVGSTPVAELVYERSAAAGKRVQAQGGAKNHVIVSDTADLAFAAEKAVSSSFACAGERCLANDIILVHASVYDDFVKHVISEVNEQIVGNGLNDATTIGALITPEHEARVREYIQAGIDDGATLLVDGRDIKVEGYESGNFVGPTVFGDVSNSNVIAQEEVFGPILGIAPIVSFRDGIDRINESAFGNAASVFTSLGAEARKFRQEVDAGNIGVNVGTAAPMAFFHFGGQKDSFFGDLHAQAEDMITFYTDEKIIIERW